MHIADMLSCATLSTEVMMSETSMMRKLCMAWKLHTLQQLKEATVADQDFQDLCEKVETGWPQKRRSVNNNLHSYLPMQYKISMQNGIVMVGDKIIIPLSFKKVILEKLHIAHQGIQRTKGQSKKIPLLAWNGNGT